jgi:phosphopantetheinyl transferase
MHPTPSLSGASRVRIALCRLPGSAALPALMARLPATMRLSVSRARRAEDQAARAMARLLLRLLLAEAGLDAQAELRDWTCEAAGRPFLAECPADFSISHAGGWAGIALGAGVRLGLDFEPRHPLDPADYAVLLTDEERSDIIQATDPGQALLRRWCLREAVLKADGCGFAVGEATVRAIGAGHYPEGRDWNVVLPDWHHGAIALASDRPVTWTCEELEARAVIAACRPLD